MFQLPELPFDPNGFGAWTSAETFSFHHGKHHAGYVTKLNAALEGDALLDAALGDVIAQTRTTNPAAFNSAAQHFNHSFFWKCLSPDGGEAEGALLEAINRDFGSVVAFKEQFASVASKHFGSGWAWLLREGDTLVIRDFHDADTPADLDVTPLLTLDVWEHAYYIDHRNDRAGFIEGFWQYVNWSFVQEQLG